MQPPTNQAISPAVCTAVVVTFEPDAALLNNLRSLCSQVGQIIVVDNGSAGTSLEIVEQVGHLTGVHLVRNEENLGIAAALNIGIRRALDAGCQWVATFDQDSAVTARYFEDLLRAYAICPEPEKVGMIVPGQWVPHCDPDGGAQNVARRDFTFVKGASNSGCLIRADIFSRIGFYDEPLFIDYVDTDFCLRLRKRGFRILCAPQVVLRHELGDKQVRRFLGLSISFRIHSAWRYYYNIRNRTVLHLRYLASFPAWVLWDWSRMLLELCRIAILEHQRGHKLSCAFRGLWDGLRGRLGRHPDFPK